MLNGVLTAKIEQTAEKIKSLLTLANKVAYKNSV